MGLIIAELLNLDSLYKGKDSGLQLLKYVNILGIPDEIFLEHFISQKEIINTSKNRQVNQKSIILLIY